MIDISIKNSSNKSASINKIKSSLLSLLKEHHVKNNSEISIEIVNKEKMLEYVKKYLKEDGEEAAAHPVLSFVQNELEGPFVNPQDGINHLGEIIVSIDHTKNEDELIELIKHGALHLLGVHHD